MVFVKKVALDFALGVAEGIVAEYLMSSWKYFCVNITDIRRVTELKVEHDATHAYCFDCDYVRSRWFWSLASVEERKAVYNRYYSGSYKKGYWYQLSGVAAF